MSRRSYPCDAEPHTCLFLDESGIGSSTPMYFCRDNCGLGVDDNPPDEEPIYKVRYPDCYTHCGGEDCACCEIHMEHQADVRYPLDSDDLGYGSYRRDDDECREDCDDCPIADTCPDALPGSTEDDEPSEPYRSVDEILRDC